MTGVILKLVQEGEAALLSRQQVPIEGVLKAADVLGDPLPEACQDVVQRLRAFAASSPPPAPEGSVPFPAAATETLVCSRRFAPNNSPILLFRFMSEKSGDRFFPGVAWPHSPLIRHRKKPHHHSYTNYTSCLATIMLSVTARIRAA